MDDVSREQALAFRVAAQGLHRDRRLGRVLDLGVQDAGGGSARVALAARAEVGPSPDPADGHGLVTGWTHRGAPHHHRPHDLPALAAASRPLSDADAAARLAWNGPEQRRVGIPAREAIDRAADALAAVVGEPVTKGAASRQVTERLPAALLRDCRPCGCTHVHEQLMRLSALPVGVGLDTTAPTLLLTPPPKGWVQPSEADPVRAADLVRAYLRVLGPAAPAHAAGFVGSSPAVFPQAWPAEAVEVTVAGRSGWVLPDDLPLLADPPEPDLVRLLPPSDPFLQLRDRDLLLPEAQRRKEVFRVLGNPGVLLVDGEVAGVWRPRASGRKLSLAVTAFEPLEPRVRGRLDEEAARVADARGVTLKEVAVS